MKYSFTSVIWRAGNKRKTSDTEALKSTINKGKSQNIGTGKNLRLQALHLAGELTDSAKWCSGSMAHYIQVLSGHLGLTPGHCSFYQLYCLILNTGVVNWQHVSLSSYYLVKFGCDISNCLFSWEIKHFNNIVAKGFLGSAHFWSFINHYFFPMATNISSTTFTQAIKIWSTLGLGLKHRIPLWEFRRL